MNVAIVHDDLTQRGGAERVALSLARMFPDAPIFTTVYDPTATYPEFADRDVRTTFLQRAPSGNPRALLPLYPAAIRSIDLRGYDLVVSSTSRFAHGVRVPDGLHIAYCHNPARFLYRPDEYFGSGGPVGRRGRTALTPVLRALRQWDQAAARRPDVYVANSRAVAARIAGAYGRAAHVVHPPLDLTRFGRNPAPPANGPRYVVVSRLLPYKRVDIAVAACTRLERPLIVIGTGPGEESLRRLAGAAVEFRSGLSDPELTAALSDATALLQPGLEDFGFAPLEANACGRPAVAYAAGGALETVRNGVTGVDVADQSVDAFVAAIERAEAAPWDVTTLRRHAESFAEPAFHAKLALVVDGADYPSRAARASNAATS